MHAWNDTKHHEIKTVVIIHRCVYRWSLSRVKLYRGSGFISDEIPHSNRNFILLIQFERSFCETRLRMQHVVGPNVRASRVREILFIHTCAHALSSAMPSLFRNSFGTVASRASYGKCISTILGYVLHSLDFSWTRHARTSAVLPVLSPAASWEYRVRDISLVEISYVDSQSSPEFFNLSLFFFLFSLSRFSVFFSCSLMSYVY